MPLVIYQDEEQSLPHMGGGGGGGDAVALAVYCHRRGALRHVLCHITGKKFHKNLYRADGVLRESFCPAAASRTRQAGA